LYLLRPLDPQLSSTSEFFIRISDITIAPYPFVCFDNLSTNIEGQLLFPNESIYFNLLQSLPWSNLTKDHLIKLEIYCSHNILTTKFYAISSLTPERYKETLNRIAYHYKAECYAINKLSLIKRKYKVEKPADHINEYIQGNIIEKIEDGNYYKFSRDIINEIRDLENEDEKTIEIKYLLSVRIRDKTIIEFKGCVVRAIRDNIFKIISGKYTQPLDSKDYTMNVKNGNIYEINKKLPPNNAGMSLSKFEVQKHNTKNYLKLNMKTINNCLQTKAFFNSERRIKQREIRNIFEKPKIEVKRCNRVEDIKRIRIQGMFVNKLYE